MSERSNINCPSVATKEAAFRELDRQSGAVHAVVSQGRTGTTTIANALVGAGRDDLIRTHTLQPKRLAVREIRYADDSRRLYHVWAAQWMVQRGPTKDRPWSLATVVRDPIAQAVSAFLHFRWQRADRSVTRSADDEVIALSDALDRQRARVSEHGLDWFDVNFKSKLGLDVYEHEFDPSIGWGRICDGRVDLMLLRTETLDQAREALGVVFGVEVPATLPIKNAAKDRSYSDLYRAVLDRFNPSPEYVDYAYAQPLARHFYSPAELDHFRRRWNADG